MGFLSDIVRKEVEAQVKDIIKQELETALKQEGSTIETGKTEKPEEKPEEKLIVLNDVGGIDKGDKKADVEKTGDDVTTGNTNGASADSGVNPNINDIIQQEIQRQMMERLNGIAANNVKTLDEQYASVFGINTGEKEG